MRGKLRGLFDTIEWWRDVFGPGDVEENLEAFRYRFGTVRLFVKMEYFGLYAETRQRGDVDGHVGSHDDVV